MAIDLALEPDLEIGSMRVSPSTREIFAGAARNVLEPRVMMVLVQLAHQPGHTVSRDQLIQGSWDGLSVSDDAINRVIGRLRKLAAETGAFTIETITKVGYRLIPSGSEPGSGVATAKDDAGKRGIPRLAIAAVFIIALALGCTAGFRAFRQPPAQSATAPDTPDPVTRDLIDNGRRAILEHIPQQQEQGMALLREAVMRAPESGDAWGALSLGYVQSLFRVPYNEQPQVELQAEAAAARALELKPGEPLALVARALLPPVFGNWLEREKAEVDALNAAGANLADDYRSSFLLFTGRPKAALPIAQQSIRRDPSIIYPHVNELLALWQLGRIDEANRSTEDAVRLFPGNYLAWFHRYFFLLYSGQMKAARAMIEDKPNLPRDIPASEYGVMERMLAAMEDPDGPAGDAIIAEYDRLVAQGRGYLENAIRVAAGIGRKDDAFRYMSLYYLAPLDELPKERFPGQRNYGRAAERMTTLLFMPPVDKLHDDPRFLLLLKRIGMVDYWRESGTRPQFCTKLADQCRAAGIPEQGAA